MEPKAVDLTVTKEHLKEETLEVYSRLFENVKKEELLFEELSGGQMNVICKVTNKKDGESVVFRNFGMKTGKEQIDKMLEEAGQQGTEASESFLSSVFVNQAEIRVMTELSKHNLCQPGGLKNLLF